MRTRLLGTGSLAAAIVLASAAAPAMAQTTSASAGAATAQPAPTRTVTNPKRETLLKLQRRITIEFTEQRLEDVIRFVEEVSGAEIEPVWTSGNVIGMDKDKLITLNVKNRPALEALEKILDKAQDDFQQNTWQLADHGALEIGPKDALNRSKRVEIYDINDLLHVIPRYTEVPQIDLQSVLQQGQGGGQSPFRDDQGQNNDPPLTRQERTQEIVDLLITLVEADQWVDNGGEGGSIRAWNGQLIVRAPDYMHRQINGYSFWPSHTISTNAKGARYVSLNMDAGVSKIDGFAEHEVSAVVGGRVIRSGPPGGGR